MPLHPNKSQFEQLAAQAEAEGSIVMLNLLRFRDQADYAGVGGVAPEGPALSGREAYGLYSEAVFPMVLAHGGNVLWGAEARQAVIAPDEEHWDEMLLVQYPRVSAFIDMISSEEYAAISLHRDAALSDSRLIMTRTLFTDSAAVDIPG